MNLVTGGTGLVGSHVLLELVKKGIPSRATYRDKGKIALVEEIFAHYEKDYKTLINRIDWIEGDILDVCSLEEMMEGTTHVYHTAAMVSFDPRNKNQLYKTNIEGTANLVNIALEKGIKKLCHVSSTAAIGLSSNGKPTNESSEWKKEQNTSDYSISKYCAEKEIWRGIEEGLDAVIVNPCIILGPGQINQSSNVLFEMVSKGLKFYTKGTNAFVDVRDVAKAMFQLMHSTVSKDRFLLISENLSYQEVFRLIAGSLNLKSPYKEVKIWMSELVWRLAYVQSKLTGKTPWISKDSARSSHLRRNYSNNKIKNILQNFEFTSIENTIDNVAGFILSQKKNNLSS